MLFLLELQGIAKAWSTLDIEWGEDWSQAIQKTLDQVGDTAFTMHRRCWGRPQGGVGSL